MHINKFFKKIGLSGDVNHKKLDDRLLVSLDAEGKNKLYDAWDQLHKFNNPEDLYSVPQTLKQASLLFSHDYQRIKTSMEWIVETVKYLNPKSLIDMGCGYGVLINYLQIKFPNKKLMGIDKRQNLIKIGRSITGLDLISGDYSKINPNDSYDTIICDFGFDLADLTLKDLPHSTSEINGVEYCPNCYEEFKKSLFPFMSGWRKWGNSKSHLIMNGRLTSNPSYLLATIDVANELKWNLNIKKTSCLKTYDKRLKDSEKYLGFLFESKNEDKVKENFVEVMKIFEMS